MANGDESVSVKHRWCCGTLLSGRFTLLTLLSVSVSHRSTLEFRTIFGADRGANAAAEAGSNMGGIVTALSGS